MVGRRSIGTVDRPWVNGMNLDTETFPKKTQIMTSFPEVIAKKDFLGQDKMLVLSSP